MTRKKVKLAYISNDSARKATFKKRKNGLMKKVNELSTLCGIDVCAIMYSPYESQPDVWPSPMGVQRVLAKFNKIPEMEQSKKMMNQESFLAQRISKASEQLKKLCRDNREKEMTQVMFQNLIGKGGVHGLNLMDLNDLGWLIDQTKKEIEKRMEALTTHDHNRASSSSSSVPAPPPPPPPAAAEPMVGMPEVTAPRATADANNMDLMQMQWMMELLNNNNTQAGHVGFGAEETMFQFGDNINANNNPLWSNAFFQWDK